MKKGTTAILPCVLAGLQFLMGQSVFQGTVSNARVELAIYVYSDDVVQAYYTYKKYDTPIPLSGKREADRLSLEEKDDSGKVKATLVFDDFKEDATILRGIWKPEGPGNEHPIFLGKAFELEYMKGTEWEDRRMYGNESTADHYFILRMDKDAGDYEERVKWVEVREKRTDRPIQAIEEDCPLRFPWMIFKDDYNFDGYMDFSILVGSGTRDNTWSHYYFYNPVTGLYNLYEPFSGMTSLDFNQEEKTIWEYNHSGMHSRTREWRFGEDGRLEMLGENCLEFREDTESWEDVDCEQ